MNEAVYTVDDVAKRLSVTRRHIWKLVRAGKIEAIDVGRGAVIPRYRISEGAVQAFIISRRSSMVRKSPVSLGQAGS